MSKYFADSILLDQEYFLEEGKTVAQASKAAGVSCVSFVRYETGEGLEKRSENFAEEVQKQMK